MDRGWARAGVLIAAAFLPAAADAPTLLIAEARWLAPGTLFDGLTRQPPECLKWPADPEARRSVAIGRAAFRAPLLLGGQAARAGLSCAACHRNGRDNPDFSFPGLSGEPGTADVTSSLMSSHRGDGSINPKPIPDLVATGRIGRHSEALEPFIRGLIVEEFDGPEPPAAVLRGLGDYVRAMDPKSCLRSTEAVSLSASLSYVEESVDAAMLAQDRETARLLVAAARSGLGHIDERFAEVHTARGPISSADAQLRTIREMPLDEIASALAAWKRQWMPKLTALKKWEARSLFSPAVLKRRLSRGSGVASVRPAPG